MLPRSSVFLLQCLAKVSSRGGEGSLLFSESGQDWRQVEQLPITGWWGLWLSLGRIAPVLDRNDAELGTVLALSLLSGSKVRVVT